MVYWYLGVGVYRYIGVLGGFMGDLGYPNIDILVPWGVVNIDMLMSSVDLEVIWGTGIWISVELASKEYC